TGGFGISEYCPSRIRLQIRYRSKNPCRLQFDEIFVCCSKMDKLRITKDIKKIENIIKDKIREAIRNSDIKNVSFGEVVVIDGNSLLIDEILGKPISNIRYILERLMVYQMEKENKCESIPFFGLQNDELERLQMIRK
ncbi:MAG: hypothetical protein JSW07_12380, partial [bacterium]